MADQLIYAICPTCAVAARTDASLDHTLTARDKVAAVRGLAEIADAHPGASVVLLPTNPVPSWAACECCDRPDPGARYALRVTLPTTRH